MVNEKMTKKLSNIMTLKSMLTKMMGNTGMCCAATGLYWTVLGLTRLYWGRQVVQVIQVIQVIGMISLDDMHLVNFGGINHQPSN